MQKYSALTEIMLLHCTAKKETYLCPQIEMMTTMHWPWRWYTIIRWLIVFKTAKVNRAARVHKTIDVNIAKETRTSFHAAQESPQFLMAWTRNLRFKHHDVRITNIRYVKKVHQFNTDNCPNKCRISMTCDERTHSSAAAHLDLEHTALQFGDIYQADVPQRM